MNVMMANDVAMAIEWAATAAISIGSAANDGLFTNPAERQAGHGDPELGR
jgi:hypothetical protein